MVNQMRQELKVERQKSVLGMIVRYYASTAEPVGSSLIAKEMGLSSATIRNIMFELEEMGLIWQPHISSGRIPTDKGYRLYINSLMKDGNLAAFASDYKEDTISKIMSNSIEEVILKSLQLCSQITSQTCVALFPRTKIRESLMGRFEEGIREALSALYDFEDRLYLDGAHFLAEQPEFRDGGKVSSVLKILEEKEPLMEILGEDLKEMGLKVHIGSECGLGGFEECALITANYTLEDDIAGTLGIIGPMRMEYDRVIPALDHVVSSISEIFG